MELWLLYATGAAVFAALTTILAKIGIKDVDSHLATAIRTMVVLVFAWIMVVIVGSYGGIVYIRGTTWVFLVLSGLATGFSWLCFFRALQLGDVGKVVPIDKSSTIMTMLLAFIILQEPVGLITVVGMSLMGIGTWLMLEIRKNTPTTKEKNSQNPKKFSRRHLLHSLRNSSIFYALLGAVFASLVAIFGKIGIADIDPTLWTAMRTVIVVPLAWVMVFAGSRKKPVNGLFQSVTRKSWMFLVLSGVATGASWLFFYHALQLGPASHVVPIDKLSIVLTMGFARLILGERFSKQSIFGLGLLTIGTLLPVFL